MFILKKCAFKNFLCVRCFSIFSCLKFNKFIASTNLFSPKINKCLHKITLKINFYSLAHHFLPFKFFFAQITIFFFSRDLMESEEDEEENLCAIMYSSYGGNICSGTNKKTIFFLAFTFAA